MEHSGRFKVRFVSLGWVQPFIVVFFFPFSSTLQQNVMIMSVYPHRRRVIDAQGKLANGAAIQRAGGKGRAYRDCFYPEEQSPSRGSQPRQRVAKDASSLEVEVTESREYRSSTPSASEPQHVAPVVGLHDGAVLHEEDSVQHASSSVCADSVASGERHCDTPAVSCSEAALLPQRDSKSESRSWLDRVDGSALSLSPEQHQDDHRSEASSAGDVLPHATRELSPDIVSMELVAHPTATETVMRVGNLDPRMFLCVANQKEFCEAHHFRRCGV